jgi:hypothetical protein
MSTPDLNRLDADALARRAYYALIEDIASDQRLLVEIAALRGMFGDKALVPKKLLRGNLQSFRGAPEVMERVEQRTRERLAQNYKIAEFFEDLFEQKNEADATALAEFIRQRRKQESKK